MRDAGIASSALLLVGLLLCSLLAPIAQLEEPPEARLSEESFSVGTNQVVAVGQHHTCTILGNSSIYCWGFNEHGQIGDGTCSYATPSCNSGSDPWEPKQVSLPNGLSASSIDAGQSHTCALADNGSVYCWGNGREGQTGNGVDASEFGQLTPTMVGLPVGSNATDISVGVRSSCAILDDGSLYCWGEGLHGSIGDGSNSNRASPTAVSLPSGRTAVSVDVGSSTVCAILDDGSMYCWGWNSHGQVGNACSPVDQCSGTNTPTRVSFPIGWQGIAISTGEYVSCAVIDDGSLYCWGSNTNGQLADEIGTGYGGNASSTPKAISLPSGRVAVDVQVGGSGTVCAILDDGSMHCWGHNHEGQIGDGTTSDRTNLTRTIVSNHGTVSSASIGIQHACAVMDDGSLYCWGSGQYGALGLGTNTSHLTSRLVGESSPQGRSVVMASTGGGSACAVMSDGDLLCWGQVWVSDSQHMEYPLPREISLGVHARALSVSVGGDSSPTICAIVSSPTLGDTLECWGDNPSGGLGQGDTQSRGDPTTVSFGGGRTAVSVSVGNQHTCAILDDGSVSCWGSNSYGQVGDGSVSDRLTPRSVSLGTNISAVGISAGHRHTCALTDNGSVYCWGANDRGQIGDGTQIQRLTPTQIDFGGSAALEISTGEGHSCALLDDGGVSCWGTGGNGEMGSSGGQALSPREVALGTGDVAVGIAVGYGGEGSGHSCAVLDDGTLKCWGSNREGELGQIPQIAQSTVPRAVQNISAGVGFSAPVLSVIAGAGNTCAIAADEWLSCWGSNDHGQRGDGSVCGIDQCHDVWGADGNYIPAKVYLSNIPGVIRVSTGLDHTCATLTDGSLQCWGANDMGQLGDGTFSDRHYPSSIGPMNSALNTHYNATIERSTTVASGEGYTCADFSIYGSNIGPAQGGLGTQLWCWGSNTWGNLGDNSSITNGTNLPFYIRGTDGSYNTVSAGRYFFCDSAICWGHNVNSSISAGNVPDGQSVQRTDLGSSPEKLDLGEAHACAIVSDDTNGNVACWGGNWDGQLGDASRIDSATANKVWLGGELSIDVSSGSSHSCAVRDDHSLWCWGGNSAYQLGSGTIPNGFDYPQDELSAIQVELDSQGNSGEGYQFSEVSAGLSHTCAIMENGSVRCWGDNEYGQLGNGDTGSVNDSRLSIPVDLGAGRTAMSVDTSYSHTCAVLDDYSLKCWGSNDHGQLGDNTTVDRFAPVMVIESSSVEWAPDPSNGTVGDDDSSGSIRAIPTVSTGYSHACALSSNGTVHCWGANNMGQLGDGSTTTSGSPVEVVMPNGELSTSMDAGGYYTCSLMDDGQVMCWGDLQGANPETIPLLVPMPVGSTVNSISVGNHHACVILDNSSIRCWGPNYQGEIGDGTTAPATSPVEVQLAQGETPVSVSAGHIATCSLMLDGDIYCWGNGDHGQLGNGNFTDSSLPALVSLPTGKSALEVSMGGNHACAILDDGEVYCWGDNYASRLGVGTTTGGQSLIGVPTKVTMPLMAGSNHPAAAVSVTTSEQGSCAILATDSIYCWGVGEGVGTIGDGSWTNATTPSLVSGTWITGDNGLTSVSGGGDFNCAVNNFTEVYCWGANWDGQLGIGNFTDQNIPRLVSLDLGGYLGPDQDGDGIADSVDFDNDNDGWFDIFEIPCLTDPFDSNSYPVDTDFDGDCDVLDTDDDNDGWLDFLEDLCLSDPLDFDSNPIDSDLDGICDALETDSDGDGVIDDDDPFPNNSSEWLDTDGDGIGNNADPDDDDDGWLDIEEVACANAAVVFYDPLNSSSMPADTDGDGICDALESDTDGDGYEDGVDIWPEDPCASKDLDGDGLPDSIIMNCNTTLVEDLDDDGDGWNDTDDAFPDDWNEWLDTDWDGIGNNFDDDDDGDGYPDWNDLFPLNSTEWFDNDMDGLGDNADLDDDNDGVLDADDDFPNDWGAYNDTDGDGMPDELEIGYSGNLTLDMDDDNDGVIDQYDPFPKDSSEWLDTDGDGIGNNADPDDDNDGWSDSDEYICGSLPEDATSVPSDADGDGICNSEDDDFASLSSFIEMIPGGGLTIVGILMVVGGLLAGGAVGRRNAYEIARREKEISMVWPVESDEWDDLDSDEIGRLLDETEKEDIGSDKVVIKRTDNPDDPLYWLKKSVEMTEQGRHEEAAAFREAAMSIIEKD